MRVAVIGSGAAGLTAAYALSQRFPVTIIEAEARAGGHANTIDIDTEDGTLAVDTGFIVYNDRTYPNFIRLLDALGVGSEASNMSFAVSLDGGRYEYAGSLGGLFAQVDNALRPDHWRMIFDIVRFFRRHSRSGTAPPRGSLAALLRQGAYSTAFCENHILPMAAAIWSSSTRDIEAFPAATFVEFFRNHGLLALRGRPQWRTVTDGSCAYVSAILDRPGVMFRGGCAVAGVHRGAGSPRIRYADGQEEAFDHVVMATHADTSLALLGRGAGDAERRLLGAFSYTNNEVVVHSDRRLMPRREAVWSSWNHVSRADGESWISYWMNRLQNLPTRQAVVVTVNPPFLPAPGTEHARFVYRHPQFDGETRAAQPHLGELQGQGNIWYCGSYCGFGFHEDAVQSGLVVAAALGAPAPWHDEVQPMSPAFGNTAPREVAVTVEL